MIRDSYLWNVSRFKNKKKHTFKKNLLSNYRCIDVAKLTSRFQRCNNVVNTTFMVYWELNLLSKVLVSSITNVSEQFSILSKLHHFFAKISTHYIKPVWIMPLQCRSTRLNVLHVSIASWSLFVQKWGDPELY